MKKLIPILILVLAAVGAYFLFGRDNGEVFTNDGLLEPQKTDPALLERLENVSVTASEDGRKVELAGGEAEFSIEGGEKGKVELGGVATEKTFGVRKDALAVIEVDSGTDASRYLVLFTEENGAFVEKSIAFLGDADVKSIITTDLNAGGAEEYVATVTALVKDANGENVQKTYIFTVENGSFNLAKSLEI